MESSAEAATARLPRSSRDDTAVESMGSGNPVLSVSPEPRTGCARFPCSDTIGYTIGAVESWSTNSDPSGATWIFGELLCLVSSKTFTFHWQAEPANACAHKKNTKAQVLDSVLTQ